MNSDSLELRVIELESQVARNEKTADELSDLVRRNAEEIIALKAEIGVLGREILQLTEGEATTELRSGS